MTELECLRLEYEMARADVTSAEWDLWRAERKRVFAEQERQRAMARVAETESAILRVLGSL